MSDLATAGLALCTVAGAVAARPVPLPAALALVALAFLRRWPPLLCVGAALLASGLAYRAWAGLTPLPSSRPWSGTATLVSDPGDFAGAVRVEVRVAGRRVEAWTRGSAGARLAERLAGERVVLAGRLEPVPSDVRARLARRHVAARLTVEDVGPWKSGDPLSRLANGLRRTLVAGTTSLGPESRALFAGFVLGDDRGQPPEVADDFRASGLSHLLVVSGENVAFVLALTAPLLRRMGLVARLAAGVTVLVFFGLLTRWEPSVVRAVAMAVIALIGATAGRPVTRLRLLALAVTGVVLVDPMLVGAVGFLMSVGACTGIVVLAAPIARALPGPRALASAAAVTVAAQVGVAPVLVPVFGGVPVASLPANLLAVPAAGPLVMWGMSVGVPAGLAGGRLATVAHLPTRVMVGWVALVARRAASLPLGEIGLSHLLVLAGAVGLLAAVRALPSGAARWCRPVAIILTLGAVAQPAAAAMRPTASWDLAIAEGVRLWRSQGATVVVLDGSRAGPTLEGLRRAAVGRIDVAVVARPGPAAAREVAPVRRRLAPRLLLAPERHRIIGAEVPTVGQTVMVEGVVVEIVSVQPRLTIAVRPRPS